MGKTIMYERIYADLLAKIQSGDYQPGDRLPSEKESAEFYGVSRITAKKAMDMLADEGLIEKKRGHGTYVKNLKAKSDNQKIVNFLREHSDGKRVASKKVLDKTVISADQEVLENLQLEEGAKVIRIERVRYADEKPMYIETNYLDYQWVPEALEKDFSKESLRVYYVNHCHIKLAKAEEKIYSILADERRARLLQVEEGAPLIYVKRVSYDENKIPREYVEAYYRADTYYLTVELAL